jgi:hypothetical protein
MTILATLKKQILALEKARNDVAQITAAVSAEYWDMEIDVAAKIADEKTLSARKFIFEANLNLVKGLEVATKKYARGAISLTLFTQVLDAVIEQSKHFNFGDAIQNAKNALINSTIKRIEDHSLSIHVLFDETPLAANEALKTNAPLYNEALNYLIKLGDTQAISFFISTKSANLNWLNSREQLERLIAVMDENAAAHLFIYARQLTHLINAKNLHFKLLENDKFRKKIFSSNPLDLRDAFASANWELADFEAKYFSFYQATWMMLTQDNVVTELTAQCKLEEHLTALDLKQLNILFAMFPTKIMALLTNEEISVHARQQLARRLLQLNATTLGKHAYEIVKIGVFKLDDTYDLKTDKDGIYNNPVIASEIVNNWTGYNPTATYANNYWSINMGTVTPQAFQYILTNIDILANVKLKHKDIQLCVRTAGAYLTPSTFLECITILGRKNKGKMHQVLNILPDYLKSCQKLSAAELTAVKTLAEQYYAMHPGKKGTLNDPIMTALNANTDKDNKPAIIGPMIFAEGQTEHLAQFVKKAENYQIPGLLPTGFVNGFIQGAKMGILGLGLAVVVDKVTSLANVFNPISMVTSSLAGNALLTTAAALTSALTGTGLASSFAIILAPLAMSIVIGGLIGAIANTSGSRLVKWISDMVYKMSEQEKSNYNTLIHGLKSANPQALRKQLYADNNLELRNNMAKMLLEQENKGYDLLGVPADIIAIVEPIKTNYYDTNKSIFLKLPDYVLGNLMSVIAFTLNVATLFVFDLYYPGPISNYLSYHAQKKLAAAMPDNTTAAEPVTPARTQAQIMRQVLPTNPATAYLPPAPAAVSNDVVLDIDSATDEVELLPPPYSPPRLAR